MKRKSTIGAIEIAAVLILFTVFVLASLVSIAGW